MGEDLLRVERLSKTFSIGPPWRRKTLRVLEHVCFALAAGEVLALLGENGAGKTTLLKILASLITPDSGRIEISGTRLGSSDDLKQLVGFASGEERSLLFRLSGRQNLRFFGALHGLGGDRLDARIDEVCTTFDLAAFLDRRADLCSSGMRTRLGLARALLHSPRILLLDEPTKSLDVSHAERVRGFIRDWAKRGNAVVFATHSTDEAEKLASQVATIEAGTLRFTPERAG